MAVLAEKQKMLRDMARDWTSNERPATEWRKVRRSGDPGAYDDSAYTTMAETGWTGIIVPEEQAGSDLGKLSAELLIEELRKPLTASTLVKSTIAASATARVEAKSRKRDSYRNLQVAKQAGRSPLTRDRDTIRPNLLLKCKMAH